MKPTVTYTGFDKVCTLKQGNDSIRFTYGVFAVVESHNGTDVLHYILKDNLGSWVTITDANGIAEQQMSFDAWGNRRDPQTWANYTNNDAFEEPMFDRGFTGHEHLYSFGFINMNGRMYDPVMSSFLSPDRYVQNPWSAQGFNRYAYCMYNPLRLTDPTGWLAGGGGGGQLPTVTIGGTTHYVLPEVVVIDDNHSLSNPPPLEEVWYTPNMNGGGAGPQWSNVYNGQSIGPSGSGGGSHGGTSVHKTTWARPSIEVCNRQNWLRQLSEFWQKENPSLYWDSNGDGKLQYKEADNWWLNAKGEDIYVDNSKIDWSGLRIPEGMTTGEVFGIETVDAFLLLPWETASTYGGTSFLLVNDSTVVVLDQKYHYNMRKWDSPKNIWRNVATIIGRPGINGTDYTIHYYNPQIKIKE